MCIDRVGLCWHKTERHGVIIKNALDTYGLVPMDGDDDDDDDNDDNDDDDAAAADDDDMMMIMMMKRVG